MTFHFVRSSSYIVGLALAIDSLYERIIAQTLEPDSVGSMVGSTTV